MSGVISGTPTAATATTTYTVTATNGNGSTTAGLTITVSAAIAPPTGLTYSMNPAIYTVGIPIAPNTPTSSGGTVVTYSVSPALPAGISLNTGTGLISGTPTDASTAATYIITATNSAGSATVALTVTVNAAPVRDVLFVVDDSGSMLSEQKRLADNFGSFINALAQAQAQRKAQGLDPLEFHIAITTSSVFEAYQAMAPAGSTVPLCGQPTAGVCNITAPYSSWRSAYSYACTTAGSTCVDLIAQYWPACGASQYGQGVQGQRYPAGNFMAAPTVTSPSNPRVLHFTKDLAWNTWGTGWQDPRITSLVSQFQQNISVGACGSGMEQHLEGGRLAVRKALAGTQPGVAPSEWPHAGAKLVVIWVGDEDDCSNPADPNTSLAFTPWSTQPTDPNPPGNDVCVHDDALPAAQRKKFPISDYADYFTSLGRPFSAAFVYSSDPASCQADASGNIVCTPGTCACQCPPSCTAGCGSDFTKFSGACLIDAACGGKSTGTRFHDLSAAFRDKGISTLDGSVCDWNFGNLLTRIADLLIK